VKADPLQSIHFSTNSRRYTVQQVSFTKNRHTTWYMMVLFLLMVRRRDFYDIHFEEAYQRCAR